MGNVVRLAPASAPTTQRGCNVNENRRSGFVLLYKSIKDATFYRNIERKSLWLHLLIEVQHERTVDTFNGNRVILSRGQLVGSARSLGEACGVSEDSARRSLDAFERDGMITRTSKQGTKGYTLITVLNYNPYQRGVSEHDGAELGAEFKAASDIGLQVVSQPDGAELGAELHAESLNNKTNKQTIDPDINPVGSEFAAATSTPTTTTDHSNDLPIPETATIHARSGKTLLWGTADDQQCAEWIRDTRAKAFAHRGLSEPKAPSLARWANDIRLMREHDGRSHREICELFAFVCKTGRELEFCQSPDKLRSQWDALQLKRSNAQSGVTSRTKPLSNLAAAQQAARAMQAQGRGLYDDDTPL
jgi:hypothetical protein